jgi:UDP-N-acetyl-D-mannosaminuronic acid dehydrogenase
MKQRPDVAIVGMGYVGLTLAVTLAQAGFSVWGCERERGVVERLNRGKPHIFEPGLEEALQANIGLHLVVAEHMPPAAPEVAIICVSTPVGPGNTPDLRNLKAAADAIAESIEGQTLVVVRSTVPVGTSRKVVLPALLARHSQPRLVACPERTIQGKALAELRRLPQVVGALDEASHAQAVSLWEHMTRVVPVSSLEAAEMVKLINNCHTDMLYAFGNQVAIMAGHLGLDPVELINAANLDYPRPPIARPGFVAGPCLTKDPYLLARSFGDLRATTGSRPYEPELVTTARAINEALPVTVARHFLQRIEQLDGGLNGAKVLVCGFAYKGWPITDDVRGSSTRAILDVLRRSPLRIYGHDPQVSPEAIEAMGAVPVHDLSSGLDGARGVLFVNEHPDYRQIEVAAMARRLARPALVYDCWRMFDADAIRSVPGVAYAGIGYG